jgi:hypothetical protein
VRLWAAYEPMWGIWNITEAQAGVLPADLAGLDSIELVSLVGSYELLVWLIRTSGAVERGLSAEHLRDRAACRAAIRPLPISAVDGDRRGGSERRASDPTRRPVGQAARLPTIPTSEQRGNEVPEPAPSMTRRWPLTGSACGPAIRFRNAGWLICSGARPAAGRERESLTHDKHHRSKTRRAPRSWHKQALASELRAMTRRLTAGSRCAVACRGMPFVCRKPVGGTSLRPGFAGFLSGERTRCSAS